MSALNPIQPLNEDNDTLYPLDSDFESDSAPGNTNHITTKDNSIDDSPKNLDTDSKSAKRKGISDETDHASIIQGDSKKVLVTFSPNDPDDPNNWPSSKKIGVIAILCSLSFCSVFGSSSYAPGETQIQKQYGVNAPTASLGLTVYVLGFAFGPLVWGPMSEIYGRRLPYLISWPLLIAVIAPSAWVDNLAVIMVFRFLAGCCAACALNNGSGLIADMYASNPSKLQKATGFYAFCPLSGPIVGSIVGFFVAAHLTHGLWVVRVHWFFVIALWPLVLLIPETHGLTILAHRASRLRASGTPNAYAAHELHTLSRKEFLWGHIGRPITMLFIEPIIIGAAIWVSLAYSIIYFFFEAYPVVFVEQNHISFQLGGLPFLGIMLGMLVCLLTMGPMTQYVRRINIPFIDPPSPSHGIGAPVNSPEAGLKVSFVGCALLPISMFWFAWTSRGNVHWISPTLAGIFFGYSMLGIFYTFLAYSSQTYRMYASSAAASNTLARSIIASVFPILAHPILNNLGTAWGVSLFGFLSLGLFPIPLIFIRYGPMLRAKSFYARESDRMLEGMRHKQVDDAPVPMSVPATEVDLEKADMVTNTNTNMDANTNVFVRPALEA